MRLTALLLVGLLLSGCTAISQSNAACGDSQVELDPVELDVKVASVAMGAASIVAALGAESSLVGQDLGSDLGLPVLNPAHQIDIEGLLVGNPDLVFVDANEPDERALEAMSLSGIEVIKLKPATSLAESHVQIRAVASALGIPARGDELVGEINRVMGSISNPKFAQKRIAFLYLRGNAGVFLLGGDGSGADDLIETLDAKDVGTELGIVGFQPISAEALLEANPDYLLVMEKGLESVGGVSGLMALPGVAGTNAAYPDRILVGKDSALLSFGPQTPNVLRCLVAQ